jgi:Beta protein
LLRGQVLQMLEEMVATPGSCRVLLDFEDATVVSVEQLMERGHRVMDELSDLGFKDFATAGSSIPPSIDLAVATTDSTGRVIRREWTVWRTLRVAYPQYSWLFGDYGVRGPKSADDIISTHTNGKIRYTSADIYFIARGHSMQKEGKGEQMYGLAHTIMNSRHYMGPEFSWGDAEIVRCSRGEFKGTSTMWIAIDTSHHMAWVVQEVAEYVMRTDQAKASR